MYLLVWDSNPLSSSRLPRDTPTPAKQTNKQTALVVFFCLFVVVVAVTLMLAPVPPEWSEGVVGLLIQGSLTSNSSLR